jgi:protein-tyrosine phosphatase
VAGVKVRLLVAGLLIAICVALVSADGGPVVAAGIENPTCELIRAGVYRIDFETSKDAGPVEVFRSSRPDRVDSDKPLVTIRKTPAQVSVAGSSGRIYFHLKPKSGATRVVSIRRLPLEGATNFRDLGGYRTSDGRYVRWGLLYRSNYLANLTAKDSEYLHHLGIRLVCDFRAEGERTRAPDHWVGTAPEYFSVPVGPNRDGTITPEELKRRVAAISGQTKDSIRGYDYAVSDAAQYGKILRRIAAGDLPAVEHCTSGKDRTGVFSAILLTALGVPRDVVMQDYLLTNQYLLGPDSIENTRADLRRIFGLAEPLDTATVKTIMTAKPETLEATFDNITKTYGSFDNYLREGLKISESELAALRQHLLEPQSGAGEVTSRGGR